MPGNIEEFQSTLLNVLLKNYLYHLFRSARKNGLQCIQRLRDNFIFNLESGQSQDIKILFKSELNIIIDMLVKEYELSSLTGCLYALTALLTDYQKNPEIFKKENTTYLHFNEIATRAMIGFDNVDCDKLCLHFLTLFNNTSGGIDLEKFLKSKTFAVFFGESFEKFTERWSSICSMALGTSGLSEKLLEYKDLPNSSTLILEELNLAIEQKTTALDTLMQVVTIINEKDSTKELEQLNTELKEIKLKFSKDAHVGISCLDTWLKAAKEIENNALIALGELCYKKLSKKSQSTQTDLSVKSQSTQTASYHFNLDQNLVDNLKTYSEKLSTQSSIGQAKSKSLSKIFQAYKKIPEDFLSTTHAKTQIDEIRTLIQQEKEGVLSQHRHWSVFNCFFSIFKPSTLESRITSLKRVNELDKHLQQLEPIINDSPRVKKI